MEQSGGTQCSSNVGRRKLSQPRKRLVRHKENCDESDQFCLCKEDSRGQKCGQNSGCINRHMYVECPRSCGESCLNQRFQKKQWIREGIEKFKTKKRGYGIKATKSIRMGQFILEYVGDVITEEVFMDRMKTLYKDEQNHYCLSLGKGKVIDSYRTEHKSRYVNHSCEPNCEMVKWEVGKVERIGMFALRNIIPNEELTYDYKFHVFNENTAQPCLCRSPNCRKLIIEENKSTKRPKMMMIPPPKVWMESDSDEFVMIGLKRALHTDQPSPISSFSNNTRAFLLKNYSKVIKALPQLTKTAKQCAINAADAQNAIVIGEHVEFLPSFTNPGERTNDDGLIVQIGTSVYVTQDDGVTMDIIKIEKVFKDNKGTLCISGSTYLRPEEIVPRPSQKFFSNEILMGPMQSQDISIQFIKGNCWIQNSKSFREKRSVGWDQDKENHVYICDYQVDVYGRVLTRIVNDYRDDNTAEAFQHFEDPLVITRIPRTNDSNTGLRPVQKIVYLKRKNTKQRKYKQKQSNRLERLLAILPLPKK